MVRHYHKPKSRKHNKKVFLLVFFLFLLFTGVMILLTSNSYLKKRFEKPALVVNGREEGVLVLLFDPVKSKLVKIIIPQETEVELAINLGVWRIGNVWTIGINEGKGGDLLAQTIIKNFAFPINLWSDFVAANFCNDRFLPNFNLIIKKFDSNLSFLDKIYLTAFCLRLNSKDIEIINLKDSTMIIPKRLRDGEMGFQINEGNQIGNIQNFFTFNFGDQKNLGIQIINASGNKQAENRIVKIIETMGEKVSFIKSQEAENIGCEISSSDLKMAKKVNKIFNCSLVKASKEGDFDLTIKIGKDFFIN